MCVSVSALVCPLCMHEYMCVDLHHVCVLACVSVGECVCALECTCVGGMGSENQCVYMWVGVCMYVCLCVSLHIVCARGWRGGEELGLQISVFVCVPLCGFAHYVCVYA